mmetsp:Transcript_18115/g.18108  ORF Transcript_18115/g.18108 Transcript_18115/m.18108 type:complete len:450 (+) Transcript_18115:273-1622(+)
MNKNNEEEARQLFERAIAACGKSFKATPLWDKYIEFEKTKKRYENVGNLYWRIIQIPNEKLHDYYHRFKLFMEAKGRKMEHYGVNLPPQPESVPLDKSDPCYETKAEMYYSATCEVLRQNRLTEIVKAYEATLKEYNKRKNYELNIKRTFFHAKALDDGQLDNWRKYLEFEESEGDHERIVLLYERCITPTCNYPEFWVRYASYIYKKHGEQQAREIYERANTKFLSRRVGMFIAQGQFEEKLDHFDAARALYKHAYVDLVPGLFDGLFKHLNLEKRAGNLEEVEKLYSQAFQFAETSTQDVLIAFVYQNYAQFQFYTMNRPQKMIELYEEALSKVSSRKSLYLIYIQSLSHLNNEDERLIKIKGTYEKAISDESELSLEEKEEMWILYLDFIRDQWMDIDTVRELEEKYAEKYYLSVPYKTSYSQLLNIKGARVQDSGPYKRAKIVNS